MKYESITTLQSLFHNHLSGQKPEIKTQMSAGKVLAFVCTLCIDYLEKRRTTNCVFGALSQIKIGKTVRNSF